MDKDTKGPDHVKDFAIIVNLEEKKVESKVLTFADVVALAFPIPPTGIEVRFTISYKNAVAPARQGDLVAGGTVEIKNGTIFNVTETGKS